MKKELPIILLALTAIPLSVLLGLAMRYADCSGQVISAATLFQTLIQLMVASILSDQS